MKPTTIALLLLGCLSMACRPTEAPPPAPSPSPSGPVFSPLTAEQAASLVALSLACAEREYPNKPGSVLDGDDAVVPPRKRTPVFYGCFDWHSAVHGHWTLVRILKLFPDLPEAAAIRAQLARHLTVSRLAAEFEFFSQERNLTFERPYGWAWLLRLAAELHTFDDPDARVWSQNLSPLADLLARRTADYLTRLSHPIRVGTHANTAFALCHIYDFATMTGEEPLVAAIDASARRFYLADRACPVAYEPSGEDFISPCLAEADLMRRVLTRREFARWLDDFLPPSEAPEFARLAVPPEIRDLQDPRIGHLIGLDFHRAWCFAGLAGALPGDDSRIPHYRQLAVDHNAAGHAAMSDSGYGGAHWLASFALFVHALEAE